MFQLFSLALLADFKLEPDFFNSFPLKALTDERYMYLYLDELNVEDLFLVKTNPRFTCMVDNIAVFKHTEEHKAHLKEYIKICKMYDIHLDQDLPPISTTLE
jgi:hypothetical protein